MDRERLQHLFECKDGVLFWKNPNARRCKKGDKAGHIDKDGYVIVRFDDKRVPAQKIIWYMAYGEMPEMLDHINGNRSDNSLSNLRKVTKRENNFNKAMRSDNTSGVCGVRWHKQRKKWNARIKIDGVEKSLGMYASFQDAVNARLEAETTFFGEYSRIMRQVEAGELVIQPAE